MSLVPTIPDLLEGPTCLLSGEAAQVWPLSFCGALFPREACCTKAQDAEIQEFYEDIMYATSCSLNLEGRDYGDALRAMFCFGCSPVSPLYVNETSQDIKICKPLAARLEPSLRDFCGLRRTSERGAVCAPTHPIVPSAYYGEGWYGIEAFLGDNGGGKPPYFEDYDVVIVDADDATLCYTSSAQCIAQRSFPLHLIAAAWAAFLLLFV
jgi:hypothetical protein